MGEFVAEWDRSERSMTISETGMEYFFWCGIISLGFSNSEYWRFKKSFDFNPKVRCD
jgi:hypothetical protein